MLEDITVRCSANGLLLACDVHGIISVSSRLNEAVPCEVRKIAELYDLITYIAGVKYQP